MKHYVDSCTACVMKDAKIEMLTQQFNEYKLKYKDAIDRARQYTQDDPEYQRGHRRYPPSGYD